MQQLMKRDKAQDVNRSVKNIAPVSVLEKLNERDTTSKRTYFA